MATTTMVGFGTKPENGIAVRTLKIMYHEIVPTIYVTITLRISMGNVTAIGNGFSKIKAETINFGVGWGNVDERAVC
ncbi:TPA: hypothetical protein ACU8BT_001239 [Neisseria subflava]